MYLSIDITFTELNETKSTLERVCNPVYCCINGIFRELRHMSSMNII